MAALEKLLVHQSQATQLVFHLDSRLAEPSLPVLLPIVKLLGHVFEPPVHLLYSSLVSAQGGSAELPKNERIQVELQINHQGEVNKARFMPQMHKIIATKTVSGEVHIFDYFKHGTCPTTDEVRPDMVLRGHESEGYGLDWNPQ